MLDFFFTDTEPQCTPNTTEALLEGEVILYTCNVEYRGPNWPKMQWSGPLRSIDDVGDDSVNEERAKTSILVTAEMGNNGVTHRCHTYFDAPANPGTDYATNAPAYEYDYNSPPLVVHCE